LKIFSLFAKGGTNKPPSQGSAFNLKKQIQSLFFDALWSKEIKNSFHRKRSPSLGDGGLDTTASSGFMDIKTPEYYDILGTNKNVFTCQRRNK